MQEKAKSADAARKALMQQLDRLTNEIDQHKEKGEELSKLKMHCATVENHLKVEKDLVAELKIHLQVHGVNRVSFFCLCTLCADCELGFLLDSRGEHKK